MPVRMLPVCASAVRALPPPVSVGEEKNTRFALHRAVPLYRVLPKLSPMVKELPPVTAVQQRFLLEGMAPYMKRMPTAHTPSATSITTPGTGGSSANRWRSRCIRRSCASAATAYQRGDDKVFVELKKKYDGVVYKRRVAMTAAQRFFKSGSVNFL